MNKFHKEVYYEIAQLVLIKLLSQLVETIDPVDTQTQTKDKQGKRDRVYVRRKDNFRLVTGNFKDSETDDDGRRLLSRHRRKSIYLGCLVKLGLYLTLQVSYSTVETFRVRCRQSGDENLISFDL